MKSEITTFIDGKAIVLVHGIGEQKRGQILKEFRESIEQYYGEIPESTKFIKRNIKKIIEYFSKGQEISELQIKIVPGKASPARGEDKKAEKRDNEYRDNDYDFCDITVTNNNRKSQYTFRVYEVFWADSFEVPDWTSVWSTFFHSIITLFGGMSLVKPFYFIYCLIKNLILTGAFLILTVFLMILWFFYYIVWNPPLIKKCKYYFETYMGDIAVYIDNQEKAKKIRNYLYDIIGYFYGYKWNEIDNDYKTGEFREDFRYKSSELQDSKKGKPREFRNISILAHSFGTVISFEVLSKINKNPTDQKMDRRISAFITTGSPLQTIRYFWGYMKSRFGGELEGNLRWNWYNIHDFGDPISSSINNYDPKPSNIRSSNSLKCGFIPFSHNYYLKNKYVMDFILGKCLGEEFKNFLRKDLKVRSEKGSIKQAMSNLLKTVYSFIVYTIMYLLPFALFYGIYKYYLFILFSFIIYPIIYLLPFAVIYIIYKYCILMLISYIFYPFLLFYII